jgi:tetratricopeptide (TPR) repeat protein
VPLLVRQPGAEGAGRLVSTPVQHIDLLPTILDLVRAPIPNGVNGRSLKPLLTDSDERIEPQPIYAESLAAAYRFGGFPVFALTLNDLRYIRGTEEAVLRITGSGATAEPAADAAGELPPLSATLDRLLAARPVPRATRIRERDREPLALAGLLPGLLHFEPQSALSAEQQQALRSAHADAARLAGARRFGAALRALQQIARTHPHLAPVHYQIALLSLELGRSQDAIAALETAVTLRPDSPELLSALAVALAPTKPADAQRHLERALELAARFGAAELALVHEAAARIALAAQDEVTALRHAESAQAAAPVRPVRAYIDGLLLAMRGDDVAAATVLQEGAAVMRQHDVDLEGLHLALADVLLRLGRYPDAEAEFQAELESYPRSVAARSGLASAQHAGGKTAEALATVDALIAAMPTPDAYAAAIRLLTAFGETSRAGALRSAARERFPLETAQARTARASRR